MLKLQNSIKYLSFFIFLIIFNNIYSQEDIELKYWNNQNKLKIIDFKGVFAMGISSANTTVGIDFFNVKKYNTFGVITVFYKKDSFFLKNIDSTKNIYLLKHEQLHFDIAELFARKIRKKFWLYVRYSG